MSSKRFINILTGVFSTASGVLKPSRDVICSSEGVPTLCISSIAELAQVRTSSSSSCKRLVNGIIAALAAGPIAPSVATTRLRTVIFSSWSRLIRGVTAIAAASGPMQAKVSAAATRTSGSLASRSLTSAGLASAGTAFEFNTLSTFVALMRMFGSSLLSSATRFGIVAFSS